MVHIVTDNNMNEALEKPLAVVDFSALWCGPCQMLSPVLDELSDELEKNVTFYNIDSDENDILSQKYDIQSIPCLIILKNGKIADRCVGFQPKQTLEKWIKSYM